MLTTPTIEQLESMKTFAETSGGRVFLAFLKESWDATHRLRQYEPHDWQNNTSNGFAQCLDELILMFQNAPANLATLKLAQESAGLRDGTQTSQPIIPGGFASANDKPLG